MMKEAAGSEYAVSQKLAYEKPSRRDLEAEFKVALKLVQNDQVTIAGYEVELRDLKGAANYAMDCIAVPAEGEEAKSVVDRLIDTHDRLLTLLKATSLAAATDALVRVKSHYPDVDMAMVKGVLMLKKALQPWSWKFKTLRWKWRTPWTIRVMTVSSSHGLGAVPPPLLSLVDNAS
jgi:hypothetical protein